MKESIETNQHAATLDVRMRLISCGLNRVI
jgi:hypothetical protein